MGVDKQLKFKSHKRMQVEFISNNVDVMKHDCLSSVALALPSPKIYLQQWPPFITPEPNPLPRSLLLCYYIGVAQTLHFLQIPVRRQHPEATVLEAVSNVMAKAVWTFCELHYFSKRTASLVRRTAAC